MVTYGLGRDAVCCRSALRDVTARRTIATRLKPAPGGHRAALLLVEPYEAARTALQSLLTEDGYCVRVALGALNIVLPDGRRQKHDHCWVMYLNESGVWEILEPLEAVAPRPAKDRAGRSGSGVRPAW